MSNAEPTIECTPKKLTRADWSHYITDWQVSELSKVEYCSVNQLSYHSFCYYQKVLGDIHGTKNKGNAFVELQFPEKDIQQQSTSATVKIVFRTGIAVTVPEWINGANLKNILCVMAG